MRGGKLGKTERHKLIIEKLDSSPAIRVSELAALINVSSETIRRDLGELEERGLISRTYGGAARPLTPDPAYRQRDKLMRAQRELIALGVSTLVNDGEVVILASSTTNVHVARRLAADKKELTVFTDSVVIASTLSPNPTIECHLCPGIYNEAEFCVYGAETVNYLSRIYAHHAILGATGINGEGVSNADAAIAETYRTMLTRSADAIIAADHQKIGRTAVAGYARWQSVDWLVTDAAPLDEDLIRGLRLGRVQVLVADESFREKLRSPGEILKQSLKS